MAHRQRAALHDSHVRNGFAVFVESLDCCDYIVHMLAIQLAAVDCEADNVAEFILLPGVFTLSNILPTRDIKHALCGQTQCWNDGKCHETECHKRINAGIYAERIGGGFCIFQFFVDRL